MRFYWFFFGIVKLTGQSSNPSCKSDEKQLLDTRSRRARLSKKVLFEELSLVFRELLFHLFMAARKKLYIEPTFSQFCESWISQGLIHHSVIAYFNEKRIHWWVTVCKFGQSLWRYSLLSNCFWHQKSSIRIPQIWKKFFCQLPMEQKRTRFRNRQSLELKATTLQSYKANI